MIDKTKKFTFAEEQAIIDEEKKKSTERKSDSYVREIRDRMRKLKYDDTAFAQFRPLVEVEYIEGNEMEKDELLKMLRCSEPFFNKKLIVGEVNHGRVKGVMKEGRLTLMPKK